MWRRGAACVALGMTLAGCAGLDGPGSGGAPAAAPEAFAHRVATSEVVVLWSCGQPEPGRLRVEGIVQNPWQAQPIQYLTFRLLGVDAEERTTVQTVGAARNQQLMTNQTTAFQLELQPAGTEVRFDLYYQYLFHERVDTSSRLAGPPVGRPYRLADTQSFLVRDVCGADQHLAR